MLSKVCTLIYQLLLTLYICLIKPLGVIFEHHWTFIWLLRLREEKLAVHTNDLRGVLVCIIHSTCSIGSIITSAIVWTSITLVLFLRLLSCWIVTLIWVLNINLWLIWNSILLLYWDAKMCNILLRVHRLRELLMKSSWIIQGIWINYYHGLLLLGIHYALILRRSILCILSLSIIHVLRRRILLIIYVRLL